MELAFPTIWIPKGFNREKRVHAAGLVNGGMVNSGHALVDGGIIRAAAPGSFVYDTFTDTSGTALTAHTGEIGATWTLGAAWSTGNGVFKITDVNSVQYSVLDSINGEVGFIASGTPTGVKYDITFTLHVYTNTGSQREIGLIARTPNSGGNASDGYYVTYNNVTGVFTLFKIKTGARTTLGTYTASLGAASDTTCIFSITDAHKILYVAGVNRIDSADNVVTAAGFVGVYSGIQFASTTTLGLAISDLQAVNT